MSVAGASSGLETNEPGQKGTHGGGRHAQDHGHGQAMVRIFVVVGYVDCDVFDDRDDADDYEPLEEGDTHRIMDMDKLCFLAQIHYYCFGIEIGQD